MSAEYRLLMALGIFGGAYLFVSDSIVTTGLGIIIITLTFSILALFCVSAFKHYILRSANRLRSYEALMSAVVIYVNLASVEDGHLAFVVLIVALEMTLSLRKGIIEALRGAPDPNIMSEEEWQRSQAASNTLAASAGEGIALSPATITEKRWHQ
jgi:hypothetical protein